MSADSTTDTGDWLAAIRARLAEYEAENPGWEILSDGFAYTHGMLKRLLAEVRRLREALDCPACKALHAYHLKTECAHEWLKGRRRSRCWKCNQIRDDR